MIIIDRQYFHAGKGDVDNQVEKYINLRHNSSHKFVSVQQTAAPTSLQDTSWAEFLIVWKDNR